MSLAGDRQRFADALSTVTDVNGFAYRPTTLNAGDAWTLYGGSDRADGLAFVHNWRVLVALPTDEVAASTWIDEHFDALVDALEQNVGYVERVDPVELPQAQFGLQLTVRGD